MTKYRPNRSPKGSSEGARHSSLEPHVAALREVADRLKAIQSAVAVAVAALRGQNADIDADVARLLVRSVSDPLQAQVDSIKSVTRALTAADGFARRRKFPTRKKR